MARNYSKVRFSKAVEDPAGPGGVVNSLFLASNGYVLTSEGSVFTIVAANGESVDVCGVEWQGRLAQVEAPKKGKKA